MTQVGKADYTADEMMAVAAARRLRNRMVCFVGIGLPSRAANLARATHAPDCVLIYESGTIGAKPEHLPLSIGDGELADTADAVVSVPEIFGYWLQGGWIDVGFLGAAQIDRHANLNSTVIGDYEHPRVRLPGRGRGGRPGGEGVGSPHRARCTPRFSADVGGAGGAPRAEACQRGDCGIMRRRLRCRLQVRL